ncbi:hypothetical protein [Pseudonocardia sp. GCM10023141]|uniref:hypothetical protein n=1 Tax=Pseudonocardia sp. GCM10023141 TaxID=3252653 RepID=UPI0036188C8F
MSDPRQPAISLDVIDAAELVEMLTFIGDWLEGTDRPLLNASLQRFAHAAYGLADLQTDLARFAFLLGDEGERLFGHLG